MELNTLGKRRLGMEQGYIQPQRFLEELQKESILVTEI